MYHATKEYVLKKLDDISHGSDGDRETQSAAASSVAEVVEAKFKTLFTFFGPIIVFVADFYVLGRFMFRYWQCSAFP